MTRVSSFLLVISLLGPATSRAEFPTVRLVPVSEGALIAPVAIRNAGDGSDRLFIVDQRGKIQIIDGTGALQATPFLDLGAKLVPQRATFDERGLLGLAFHPNYGSVAQPGEGKFYVYYSAPSPNEPGTAVAPVDHMSVIAEYCVSAGDPNIADAASERILLTFDQPQFNHDGGDLAFGPVDGLLHISTGDGGSSNDNNAGHTGGDATRPSGGLGNSQDITKLLGKILRVDPLGNNGPGGEFGIPAGNPFVGVGGGGREEIFAYGLRNPWRICFDDGTGGTNRLFVADVGQGEVEEINLVASGDNLGWRNKEGTFDFDVTAPGTRPFVDPVAQYQHPGRGLAGLTEIGLSVTGGCFYRGTQFPSLEGKYLFGDWSTDFQTPNGTLLGLEESAPGVFELETLTVVGGNPIGKYITGFGKDEDGEIYVATRTVLPPEVDPATLQPTGGIFRIEPVLTELMAHLEPEKDNSLFEENVTFSNGTGEWLFSGLTQNNDDRRALLQFDIASRIPEGSTITGVTLRLTMDKTIAGAADFDLHRLTENWGEFNSNAPGEEGKGIAAAAGDATWDFSKFNTDGWASAGGDFAVTASATTAVTAAANYEWSSGQMVQDIQDWLDGTVDNFGWILLSANPNPPTAKRFKSRESGTAGERPQLWVTYITDSPPRNQPDGRIQEKGKSLKGNDVYNLSGRRQTLQLKGRAGRRFDHRFSVQNDGDVSDDFIVKGTKGNRFFDVDYFQLGPGGRKNVTNNLVKGRLKLIALNPGDTVSFLAKIRSAKDSRGRTKRRQFSYLSTSVTQAASRDKVKAKATTGK